MVWHGMVWYDMVGFVVGNNSKWWIGGMEFLKGKTLRPRKRLRRMWVLECKHFFFFLVQLRFFVVIRAIVFRKHFQQKPWSIIKLCKKSFL